MQPGFVLSGFVESQENAVSIDTCLGHLRGGQVFLRMFDGSFDHRLDLFVSQTIRRFHIDRLFNASSCVARSHVEDAVGINQETHFDSRHSGREWRNAFQIETREAAAILCEFTLALHHVNQNIGLAIDSGRECFSGAGRYGRVPVNDFRDNTAIGLDSKRQRRDVEK